MEELKHAFWTNYIFSHNVALNLLRYDNSFLGPYHISVYNTEEEEIEYANYDENTVLLESNITRHSTRLENHLQLCEYHIDTKLINQ